MHRLPRLDRFSFRVSSKKLEFWRDQYRFSLVDSPYELERVVTDKKDEYERNRLVAGFCWPWSDPLPDGSLVPDVVIDDWARPWNTKAGNKSYRPEKHPYTLWADTPRGEKEIGCIYSAQGFEFDRVGVIWGEDLVWRGDGWVAQRNKSKDGAVRPKTVDTQKYLRNAYRVLMTRGILETQLYCIDDETREHLSERLEEIRR